MDTQPQAATVTQPTRPAPASPAPQPQFRVLQSRRAPAQRSLFAGLTR